MPRCASRTASSMCLAGSHGSANIGYDAAGPPFSAERKRPPADRSAEVTYSAAWRTDSACSGGEENSTCAIARSRTLENEDPPTSS